MCLCVCVLAHIWPFTSCVCVCVCAHGLANSATSMTTKMTAYTTLSMTTSKSIDWFVQASTGRQAGKQASERCFMLGSAAHGLALRLRCKAKQSKASYCCRNLRGINYFRASILLSLACYSARVCAQICALVDARTNSKERSLACGCALWPAQRRCGAPSHVRARAPQVNALAESLARARLWPLMDLDVEGAIASSSIASCALRLCVCV